MDKKIKWRIAAAAFCFLFVISQFLMAEYIVMHIHHRCGHAQDCGVCLQIRTAGSILKQTISVAVSAVFFIACLAVPLTAGSSIQARKAKTPVSLKIRMND